MPIIREMFVIHTKMNGCLLCEISLTHSYSQGIKFPIVWCIMHLDETRNHGNKTFSVTSVFRQRTSRQVLEWYWVSVLKKHWAFVWSKTETFYIQQNEGRLIRLITPWQKLLLKHLSEGKFKGMRRRGWRRKQLLDYRKGQIRHRNLKENELDRTREIYLEETMNQSQRRLWWCGGKGGGLGGWRKSVPFYLSR
jgi:hypothetical protein